MRVSVFQPNSTRMRLNLIFVGLLVIYNFFFWKESAGLNLVIFTALILGVSAYLNRFAIDKNFWIITASYLVSAVACLTINSELSVFVLSLSTVVGVGYLNYQSSPIEAFLNSLSSFFTLKKPVLPQKVGYSKQPIFRYLGIAAFPLLVITLYMLMFSAGNPVFKQYSQAAFGNIFSIFENIHLPKLFFLLFGILILRWVFMRGRPRLFSISEQSQLIRQSKQKVNALKLVVGLRKEFQMAMLLLISLNVLFALVNFIDVKYVWFQFHYSDMGLKDFLHEGFYWLILSLLISIGLVLYVFRQNLNFYPKNGRLKFLAHLWIAQNMILAFSVGLRCLYYIQYHGLAPGRITVIIFLSMVFFGLSTLLIKVAKQKNLAWVLKVNSAAVLLILAASSAINWDKLTDTYNLNHYASNQIDIDHYLDLDPQQYHYLLEHFDKIEKQIEAHNQNPERWVYYSNAEAFRSELIHRSKNYLRRRDKLSLYSWTYSDWKAEKELKYLLSQLPPKVTADIIEPPAS